MLDVNGQPVAAFIYHDAMTESRCDTPHLFAKGERHSKQGKTISNRVFAVEIVCIQRCKLQFCNTFRFPTPS